MKSIRKHNHHSVYQMRDEKGRFLDSKNTLKIKKIRLIRKRKKDESKRCNQ